MTCPHRAAHGLTGLCATCEDQRHASEHMVPVEGCMACKLSRIQWSPSATPSTYNTIPPKAPDNSWERGVVTQDRPGGTVMPILDRNSLDPMPIKDLSTRRHEVEDGLRRLRQTT